MYLKLFRNNILYLMASIDTKPLKKYGVLSYPKMIHEGVAVICELI